MKLAQNIYLQHSSGILGKVDSERVAAQMQQLGWTRISRYVWRRLAKEQGRMAQDKHAVGESANEVSE